MHPYMNRPAPAADNKPQEKIEFDEAGLKDYIDVPFSRVISSIDNFNKQSGVLSASKREKLFKNAQAIGSSSKDKIHTGNDRKEIMLREGRAVGGAISNIKFEEDNSK